MLERHNDIIFIIFIYIILLYILFMIERQTKKTTFILWPDPDCLMAAALIVKQLELRRERYEIIPSGKNTILACLLDISKTTAQGGMAEIHIFVPFVKTAETGQIRATVIQILGKQGKVFWYSQQEAHGISDICKNLNDVQFFPGAIHTDASVIPIFSQPKKYQSAGTTYRDVLQYKITRAFLGSEDRNFDTSQLKEILEDISLPKKEFADKYSHSVKNFIKNYPAIEGKSKPIIRLKREVYRLARAADINVLLLGATGTGKEAAAFYLHDLSDRRDKPYGALNCAILREEFLHSTLFGHKKGSFTGAVADRTGMVKSLEGGTIFLDELPDMPLSIQTMLLRFLEDGSYIPLGGTQEDEQYANLRIIAAAQPELIKEKKANKEFRNDLYFRIAEKVILVPQLKEITEDIMNLVIHFVYKMSKTNPKGRYETIEFFEKNLNLLNDYSWPGNARELAGYVKRRLLLGHSEEESIIQDISSGKPFLAPDTDASQTEKATQRGTTVSLGFSGGINRNSTIDTHKEMTTKYIRHVYEQLRSQGVSKREICNKLGIANQITLNRYLGNI